MKSSLRLKQNFVEWTVNCAGRADIRVRLVQVREHVKI